MRYDGFPVAAGDLDPEDAKIVRLARTARQRAYVPHGGVAEGAALRDRDGRTYAAATVELADPAQTVTAVAGAFSAAFSSGARRFEALTVVSQDEANVLSGRDAKLAAELAPGVPVLLAGPDGTVRAVAPIAAPEFPAAAAHPDGAAAAGPQA